VLVHGRRVAHRASVAHLPVAGQPRAPANRPCSLAPIPSPLSVRERPASVEDRAVPGHWEGDLLCGSGNSQIATLVERSTRYVMLVKVDRNDTQTVVDALIQNARELPTELYRTLTWDRGKELADHHRFTLATDIQVYFCDPQHPWQRGTNENQRLASSVLPEGHRPVVLLAGQSRRGR
jgi:IS30 family transposase